MMKRAMSLFRSKSPINFFIRLNVSLWKRLPVELRSTRPMRWYGKILHKLVSRRADRRQFTGTFFLRNRPMLELICRLIAEKPQGSTLNIAVLGCSIGAEVYSILWTIRSARPDLNVRLRAVDNSAEVLKIAEEAVYTSHTCELVGASIFERLTDAEFEKIFEGDRREARVRPWLREGVSWHLGDASDPGLTSLLEAPEMLIASNFLCHMAPPEAENCLRNIASFLRPGGFLFVSGIDLDVRAKVARDLRWQPVPELIKEIHDGDPTVRGDWPCAWWGLEPRDSRRDDWQMRYAAVFQLNEGS